MAPEPDPDRGETISRVTFRLTDPQYPFVGISDAMECRFKLAEMVPRADDHYAEFFRVEDADPAAIVDVAADDETIATTNLLRDGRDGLVEFETNPGCPAVRLAEHGALPRDVRSEDGEGRITAEIPPQFDSATVVEGFLAQVEGAELVTMQERESFTPLFAESGLERALQTSLTERQREVLEAAFGAGYYEWPREATGSEVAESLGITSATFSEHIHAAERNLLGTLFDDGTGGDEGL